MDLKSKKQLWLETLLKKLYRKVNYLQPGEKVKKPKPVVNVIYKKGFPKRKADSDTEKLPSTKKQKKCPKETCDEPSEEDNAKENSEVFWDFVDEFILSRSFHARTKKGFFNSMNVPSTVNYSVWKNIGKSISLRSRVVCLTPEKLNLIEEEDFLRHQLSSMDEERALALKIFFKVQKARMRKSAEEISREFLEEENST